MDYICLEWSGSHCMHKQAKARWIWRHGSPESVWNLRAMTLLFRGQTTEFHMHKHLPFLPIASHKLVSVSYCLLISQATPFTDEACDTTTWKMETCWKEDSEEFFALFAVILQVSTCHLCAWGHCVSVCWAMMLIGNAKQATGGGKSGVVETGLTGLVAMVLLSALAL